MNLSPDHNLIETIGTKSWPRFRCKFCQKTYVTKGNLYRHLRTTKNHRSNSENCDEIAITDHVQDLNLHLEEKRVTVKVCDMDQVESITDIIELSDEDVDEFDGNNSVQWSIGDDTEFLDDLEFTDMEVMIKGKTYKVHKFMLSKSPVLKSFITDEAFEGFIDIPDELGNAFTEVLRFLYENGKVLDFEQGLIGKNSVEIRQSFCYSGFM